MSELNKLKVVDFTAGRLSSDDINTNIPFRDNLSKTRTIQQANAVIGAYVNRNYTDMQNKADKDEIPTKVSELENDEGYITTGDIPSKTSDLTNDGEDGEHPFITNQVNDLANYTNNTNLTTLLNNKASTTDLNNVKSAIDYKSTNYMGNVVVESVRSKNMFNGVLLNGVYNDTTGEFTPSVSLCSEKIKIKSNTSYYLSGVTGSVRVHYWNNNTYVGNEVITAPNLFVSQGNITAFQFGGSTPHSNIQLEEGLIATTYMPYQQLDDFEFENVPFTRNTTYITNIGYSRVIKYGKICFGYFNVRLTGSIADGTTLISGLPQCYFERFGFSAASSNNLGFRFYIDNTGNIHADGAISFEGWVAGNFIFPIK